MPTPTTTKSSGRRSRPGPTPHRAVPKRAVSRRPGRRPSNWTAPSGIAKPVPKRSGPPLRSAGKRAAPPLYINMRASARRSTTPRRILPPLRAPSRLRVGRRASRPCSKNRRPPGPPAGTAATSSSGAIPRPSRASASASSCSCKPTRASTPASISVPRASRARNTAA